MSSESYVSQVFPLTTGPRQPLSPADRNPQICGVCSAFRGTKEFCPNCNSSSSRQNVPSSQKCSYCADVIGSYGYCPSCTFPSIQDSPRALSSEPAPVPIVMVPLSPRADSSAPVPIVMVPLSPRAEEANLADPCADGRHEFPYWNFITWCERCQKDLSLPSE